MSDRDGERGKYYGKKKFNNHRNDRDQKPFGRNNRTLFKDKESKCDDGDKNKMKQPQILIKTREKIEDSSLSPKHSQDKEEINTVKEILTNNTSDAQLFHNVKRMHKAVKLLDDGILYNDNIQDYLNETSDFLVVGIVGNQGVGKSTVMNILASENHNWLLNLKGQKDGTEVNHKHFIFKTETSDDCENCIHATNGIDMYITDNRMILLDCQPFMSSSVIDELIHNELKRSSLLGDVSTVENAGEIQGMQHIAFLMSVCHVIIFTQDFIVDFNNVRFLLTAELLKPTISNIEEEFVEQYPHMLILHTKVPLDDFIPEKFNEMQKIYRQIFRSSKFHIETGLGLGTGKIIPTLNEDNCGPNLNLFLLPEFDYCEESVYQALPPLDQLAKTLRRNISCVTKFPISHVSLTEKTWLSYCTKVWDHVKKSSFYVEYAKVLP